MTGTQLAERLAIEIAAVIQDEGVAAEVNITHFGTDDEPSVEVRPTKKSDAPAIAFYVLGRDSIAVRLGETASADWTDSRESIIEEVRRLVTATFRGGLQEEVTRDRKGSVVGSTVFMTSETGRDVLWTRSSAKAFGLRAKTHELNVFPAYPPVS